MKDTSLQFTCEKKISGICLMMAFAKLISLDKFVRRVIANAKIMKSIIALKLDDDKNLWEAKLVVDDSLPNDKILIKGDNENRRKESILEIRIV